jgi:hypothetical protein
MPLLRLASRDDTGKSLQSIKIEAPSPYYHARVSHNFLHIAIHLA